MYNQSKLVKIYLLVRDRYEKELQYSVQRFSNNHSPRFTDPEILTILLYCTAIEERFTMRQVYDFTSNHLRSWFPLLPSYPAFVMRTNLLSEAFRMLLQHVLDQYAPSTIS